MNSETPSLPSSGNILSVENIPKKSVWDLRSSELSVLVSGLTLILGVKGMGKTSLLLKFLETPEVLTDHQLQQAVIWDTTGNVARRLGNRIYLAETFQQINDAFRTNSFPLCVQSTFDNRDLLDYFCQWIWAKGNCLVLFDEADTVFCVRDTLYLPNSLKNILARSRHRNLGVCVAVRTVSEVPATVRKFAERLILFRTTYRKDLDVLESFIETDLSELKSLERGVFVTSLTS